MPTRLGAALLRSGAVASAVVLFAGAGLSWHYLLVTPSVVCSAALTSISAFQILPWAMLLLVSGAASLPTAARGLVLLLRANRS